MAFIVRARVACLLRTRAFRANPPAASSFEVSASAPGERGALELDLSNPRIAFQVSSSFELARGVAVLTACSQPWLVRNAESMLALLRWLLGGPTTDRLLRHSVFAHFVAGETPDEIGPLLARLHSCGVGGILDYAAEADLGKPGVDTAGTSPPASASASASAAAAALMPRNQPARVFEYQSEAQCDANLRTFLACVTAVRQLADIVASQ